MESTKRLSSGGALLRLAGPSMVRAFLTMAASLKISIGAEATSLGGLLPMQEGVDAVFSTCQRSAVTNNALTLTHAALFADTRVDALGGAFQLNKDRGTGAKHHFDARRYRHCNETGADSGSVTP